MEERSVSNGGDGVRPLHPGFAMGWLDLTFLAVGCLFLVAFIWASISYWRAPCFIDHVEVQVACVAHRMWTMHAIHALDTADRYSTVLGPDAYIWNALWQGPHPGSIFEAKTPGIAAIYSAIALLFVILWKRLGWRPAVTGAGVLAMLGLMFRHYAYWNRPDPMLLLFVTMGVGGALASRHVLGSILFGAAIGLAMGAKFHSVIFFLPLVSYLDARAFKLRSIGAATGAALLAAASPFLLPQVSLPDYLRILSTLSAGPAVGQDLGRMAFLLAVMTLPVVCLAMAGAERSYLLLALWSVMVVVLLVATAIIGLERHHALPLAALVAPFVADLSKRRRSPAVSLILVYFVILAGGLAAAEWIHTRNDVRRTAICDAVREDVESILSATPDLTHAMGYAGNRTYGLAQMRVLLEFRDDEPLYLDGAALMDHRKAGLSIPELTLDALRQKRADLWLIPRGEQPWSLRHFYRHDWEIFSEEFRSVFAENYSPVASTRFFNLWLASGKKLPNTTEPTSVPTSVQRPHLPALRSPNRDGPASPVTSQATLEEFPLGALRPERDLARLFPWGKCSRPFWKPPAARW